MTDSHYGFKPAGLAVGYINRGEDGVSWVFDHCMDADDRDAFDEALLSIKHPLIYQAGTQETRFRAYVKELVQFTAS